MPTATQCSVDKHERRPFRSRRFVVDSVVVAAFVTTITVRRRRRGWCDFVLVLVFLFLLVGFWFWVSYPAPFAIQERIETFVDHNRCVVGCCKVVVVVVDNGVYSIRGTGRKQSRACRAGNSGGSSIPQPVVHRTKGAFTSDGGGIHVVVVVVVVAVPRKNESFDGTRGRGTIVVIRKGSGQETFQRRRRWCSCIVRCSRCSACRSLVPSFVLAGTFHTKIVVVVVLSHFGAFFCS
mmetsp:Transcript_18199/g.37860  ORF Transcript_18199/g.37860 Transcript_18199/m.37860 type:complete len:236 (-) Transcript_18199:497-1204(-)